MAPTIPMNPAPKRRWFRWTLSTLFVVMTVFACWLAYELNWIRQRQQALESGVVAEVIDRSHYARGTFPAWAFGPTRRSAKLRYLTMEFLARLQQHSGLSTTGSDVPRDTLAEFIFQIQRSGKGPDLDLVTADIVACIDGLNKQLNSHQESPLQAIDRQIVYAVSGIVAACLDKAIEMRRTKPESPAADHLLGVAWHVQFAWDALLAGDIENLQGHVAEEREARVGQRRIWESSALDSVRS